MNSPPLTSGLFPSPPVAREQKRELRAEAMRRRDAQPELETVSQKIAEKLFAQPEWTTATTVMSYIAMRSEVRTRAIIERAWAEGKTVAVPFCAADDHLEVFRLEDFDELAPGTFGVLEPAPAIRAQADRRVTPERIDLIVVPGLAFDRQCGRVGYGKGYYDKFLRHVRDDAAKIAVALECQMVAAVPTLPHDVPVHRILTEQALYTHAPATR